jgi:hypothetical protein
MTRTSIKKLMCHNRLTNNKTQNKHSMQILMFTDKSTLCQNMRAQKFLQAMLVVCTWLVFDFGFKFCYYHFCNLLFFNLLIKHQNEPSYKMKLIFNSIPWSLSSMIKPWPPLHLWHCNLPQWTVLQAKDCHQFCTFKVITTTIVLHFLKFFGHLKDIEIDSLAKTQCLISSNGLSTQL